jgi:hypothetical protein
MKTFSLTLVFSTKKINEAYVEHIKKTCGLEDLELLITENNGEKSLTEVYNDALNKAKNDIIVFCHDDLIFNTPYWGKKLIKHFNRNPKYGIIGVAGTNNLIDGTWWSIKKSMHGIVNHTDGFNKWASVYSQPQGNKIKEMVVLDGLFLAVDKSKLKHKEFDPTFKGFHFYDLPICLNNHILGVKVGLITDIRLTHLSVGQVNEQWYDNKTLFESKYKDLLPKKI